jgi:hypothetical protein
VLHFNVTHISILTGTFLSIRVRINAFLHFVNGMAIKAFPIKVV